MEDLKKKAVKGIFWTFVDRAGSQVIGFIVTILLARMLAPDQFGLVAMASVVIAVTRIFIDSGLRDSLIQKSDCTQIDYSTVFFFNIGIGAFLLAVIYISAPFIALFFGYDDLTNIIRALGLIPFLGGWAIVQETLLQKELKFKMLAKFRIPAFIVSGIVGLVMAWFGFGVWSLVIQAILEILVFNVLLWVKSQWRPTFLFDKPSFIYHWKHGSRLLLINALTTIHLNVFSLIVGKFFSPAQLGFYSRAEAFKTVVYNNSINLIQTVSYPLLSKIQGDSQMLKARFRTIQQFTMFVLLPIVGVLITNSESIISLLLTDKWLPTAPILQVLMLAMVFAPFNSINLNILKVKRRTDLLLYINIVNKIFLIVVVLISANLGFEYLIWTNFLMAIVTLLINNFYTDRLIGFSMKEQIYDLFPLLVAFVVTVVLVILLDDFLVNEILIIEIIVKSLVLVGVYVFVIFILKRDFIFDAKRNFVVLLNR